MSSYSRVDQYSAVMMITRGDRNNIGSLSHWSWKAHFAQWAIFFPYFWPTVGYFLACRQFWKYNFILFCLTSSNYTIRSITKIMIIGFMNCHFTNMVSKIVHILSMYFWILSFILDKYNRIFPSFWAWSFLYRWYRYDWGKKW